MSRFILSIADLGSLTARLSDQGYEVLCPVLDSGVIRLASVRSPDQLPLAVGDEQAPGRYRTVTSDHQEFFGYAVGPDSLKRVLFPSRREVWTSTGAGDGVRFRPSPRQHRRTAVIGARPCDLAGMLVQDRVLAEGEFADPDYVARRRDLFLVVVNCTRPAETCFCASMGTGPAAFAGFDLALTEVRLESRHFFLTEAGSDAGAELLERLGLPSATQHDEELAEAALSRAVENMTRSLATDDLHDLLQANPAHSRWASIAERCLACANCTMVCPTCFCTCPEPTTALDGTVAGQERRWDSCFSLDFSYMGGRPVRASVESRYRQWLTHKLSTWVDQFGTLGCVGCGRCITWCPVGIDLTEEISRLREPELVDG